MAQISVSHYSFESSSSDFEGAVSPGASMYADLTVGGASRGPVKSFITAAEVIAVQNLDWRLEFHKRTYSNVVNTASYFPPNLIGWVNLVGATHSISTAMANERNAVATTYGTVYAWFINNLSIPYEDSDGEGELHVNLVNKSASAKTAGAAGYLYLRVGTVQAS